MIDPPRVVSGQRQVKNGEVFAGRNSD
jgi:hypothetical protein